MSVRVGARRHSGFVLVLRFSRGTIYTIVFVVRSRSPTAQSICASCPPSPIYLANSLTFASAASSPQVSDLLLCISESSQFRVLFFDQVAFDRLCYAENSSSLIHVRWLGTNMGDRSCPIRSFVLSSVSPLCACTADL